MDNIHLFNAMQEMLYYALVGVCVMTLPILVVGLALSIVQAATQINEMTLTFIPKFIVMCTLLFMISPWLMHKLITLTDRFMMNLPTYIR